MLNLVEQSIHPLGGDRSTLAVCNDILWRIITEQSVEVGILEGCECWKYGTTIIVSVPTGRWRRYIDWHALAFIQTAYSMNKLMKTKCYIVKSIEFSL